MIYSWPKVLTHRYMADLPWDLHVTIEMQKK